MKSRISWRACSFFSKSFIGIGIDLDFRPTQITETLFTFQLTLFFWRIWFVKYK